MRKVCVDFVARSPLRGRVALAITIASLVFAAAQIYLGLGERRRALALEEQLRVLQEAAAVASAPKPGIRVPEPPYARDAAAIARAASYDFGAVLKALETVRLPNIKVTSIDIVTAEASARIELEFTDPGVLLNYLEELNLGRPDDGGKWRLVRAQMPTTSTPGTASIAAPADMNGDRPKDYGSPSAPRQ